mgnify:CR=1 FL=1
MAKARAALLGRVFNGAGAPRDRGPVLDENPVEIRGPSVNPSKRIITRNMVRKVGALAAAPTLKALKARLDPRAYNGASMVGLKGVVIKSHGGADRMSFANAVRVAVTEARNGVPDQIVELLARVAAKPATGEQ